MIINNKKSVYGLVSNADATTLVAFIICLQVS